MPHRAGQRKQRGHVRWRLGTETSGEGLGEGLLGADGNRRMTDTAGRDRTKAVTNGGANQKRAGENRDGAGDAEDDRQVGAAIVPDRSERKSSECH